MRYKATTKGCDQTGNKFGWAWVLADDTGRILGSKYGCDLIDESWAHAWSIAAECTAVIDLLKSLKVGVEIEIIHNDESPGKWADGQWIARSICAKGYCASLLQINKTVTFTWIKKGSGHKLNELADNLAHKALNEQPVTPVFGRYSDL